MTGSAYRATWPRNFQCLAQGRRPTRSSIAACRHRLPDARRSWSKNPSAGTPHTHAPGRLRLSATPAPDMF